MSTNARRRQPASRRRRSGSPRVSAALTTTGGAEHFGEGIDGTATWAYELTDVIQPIALPADCPAGVIDAPLLPDAADDLNEPGVLSYVTTATAPEAATFYQAELASLGWQATTDAVVTDAMALQDFTRGHQQLSLTIAASEEGTTVLIVVEPAEQ